MLKQLFATGVIVASLTVGPPPGRADTAGDALVQATTPEQPLRVRTMTVPDPQTVTHRQFFGQVTARDTVSLSFEVGGRIETLTALEGARVTAGSLIASLDLDPFDRRIERAELALAQADRERRRAQALAERNVASQVRAENAQTAYDMASVELRDAHAAREDAQIIAPFDALVADRIASQHAITETGAPIVRLHDLSEMRVQFDLPERLLSDITDLEQVAFHGRMPGSDHAVALEFREFRAETGSIGQSYVVSLAIVDPVAQGLLPGQTMIVRGAVAQDEAVPALPLSAVATAADGHQYVVVLDPDATGLRARHVRVDVTAPTGAGIRVAGVQPGLEIVEVGAHAVADGALVDRFSGLTQSGS